MPVEIELQGSLATLSLNGPPANALGEEMIGGLHEALTEAERAEARVIVLRSGVDRFFSAGADLKLITASDAPGLIAYVESLREVIERIADSDAVSIAAIEGRALGGGLELALACTLRVAAPDARLGLPEIKLGLLPGAGGTQRLPRLVGPGPASDLLLTGRSVDGAEALRIGLVERLAPASGSGALAAELGAELARLSRPALSAALECLAVAPEAGMARELELLGELFEGADAAEGLVAYRERRAPRFA